MSLQLVKNGMTDAVMFNPMEKTFFLQQFVQEKHSCFRGSFRPVTK
jgi:hypothetical protein